MPIQCSTKAHAGKQYPDSLLPARRLAQQVQDLPGRQPHRFFLPDCQVTRRTASPCHGYKK